MYNFLQGATLAVSQSENCGLYVCMYKCYICIFIVIHMLFIVYICAVLCTHPSSSD